MPLGREDRGAHDVSSGSHQSAPMQQEDVMDWPSLDWGGGLHLSTVLGSYNHAQDEARNGTPARYLDRRGWHVGDHDIAPTRQTGAFDVSLNLSCSQPGAPCSI